MREDLTYTEAVEIARKAVEFTNAIEHALGHGTGPSFDEFAPERKTTTVSAVMRTVEALAALGWTVRRPKET